MFLSKCSKAVEIFFCFDEWSSDRQSCQDEKQYRTVQYRTLKMQIVESNFLFGFHAFSLYLCLPCIIHLYILVALRSAYLLAQGNEITDRRDNHVEVLSCFERKRSEMKKICFSEYHLASYRARVRLHILYSNLIHFNFMKTSSYYIISYYTILLYCNMI